MQQADTDRLRRGLLARRRAEAREDPEDPFSAGRLAALFARSGGRVIGGPPGLAVVRTSEFQVPCVVSAPLPPFSLPLTGLLPPSRGPQRFDLTPGAGDATYSPAFFELVDEDDEELEIIDIPERPRRPPPPPNKQGALPAAPSSTTSESGESSKRAVEHDSACYSFNKNFGDCNGEEPGSECVRGRSHICCACGCLHRIGECDDEAAVERWKALKRQRKKERKEEAKMAAQDDDWGTAPGGGDDNGAWGDGNTNEEGWEEHRPVHPEENWEEEEEQQEEQPPDFQPGVGDVRPGWSANYEPETVAAWSAVEQLAYMKDQQYVMDKMKNEQSTSQKGKAGTPPLPVLRPWGKQGGWNPAAERAQLEQAYAATRLGESRKRLSPRRKRDSSAGGSTAVVVPPVTDFIPRVF